MNILYVNENNKIHQYFFESEQQCYDKVNELKCRWYKIYREENTISNYFESSFEWDYEKNDLKVNIEKVKEIKRNEYRLLRPALFEKLDIKFMKALETNDQSKLQEITILKEKLRNITEIELPNVKEELFTFYPECIQETLFYLAQN
jgi:hypothetical protein